MTTTEQQRRSSRIRYISETSEASHEAMTDPDPDDKAEWKHTNANFYDDGAISFLWRRHTLLALAAGLAYLLYVAMSEQEVTTDDIASTKRGLAVAAFMFIMVGVTQFNDGPFTRPHPALWRAFLAVSVLYWLILVFLLFQTPAHARHLLSYLDDSLGKPPEERTYAERCDLYDPDHPSGNPYMNIIEKMDIFVIAHSLGWFVKALILRSAVLCHIQSVVFELLEYTLQFHMPNFAECWWDHWLLDVLICNAIGIHLGMWTCKWLTVKEYRWIGFWNIRTYSGRMKRLAQQFTPYNWTSFDWHALADLRSWLLTVLVMLLVQLCDVSAFYLKDVLWVPANHIFNIYRLLVITPVAAVATRETFQYARDRNCVRFGQQTWVLIFVVTTELLLAYKFGGHLSQRGAPDMFWLKFWGAMVFALVLWTLVYFLIMPHFWRKRPEENVQKQLESEKAK